MERMRILSRKEVSEKTTLCRTSLYMMAKNGTFPKPIKLGPQSIGWIETEGDAWIMEKIAMRDGITLPVPEMIMSSRVQLSLFPETAPQTYEVTVPASKHSTKKEK